MTLSSHLPDLASLELLRDVTRLGSIGAAAREHGISQQAASARLRGVEAQVGAPLLRRSVRGARPTAAGALLVEWSERLLDAATRVDLGIATLRADRRASLPVAASMTIAEHLLPQWLMSLQAQQRAAGEEVTAVTLTATNSDTVITRVREGGFELGFVEGPAVPPSLGTRVVGTDDLVVVVAPGHPWTRRRTPLTPAALAATPLVAREAGSGTRQFLDAALAAASSVAVAPVLELTTSTGVREAVRAGGSPAVLSRLAVESDLLAHRLVQVPVTGLDLRRTLRAVWPQGAAPAAGPARDLVALAVRESESSVFAHGRGGRT